MNIDQVMQIYREAVDPTATAGGGLDWWREVQAEVVVVIAAPTKFAAATVIAWRKSEYERAEWRLADTCVWPYPPGGKNCFELTGKTACSRKIYRQASSVVWT